LVIRSRRLLVAVLIAASASYLVMPRLAAHEVNIHWLMTQAAVDHLVAQYPDLRACGDPASRTQLGLGVIDEDNYIPIPTLPLPRAHGRFMHHFSPPLDDVVNNVARTPVSSTCSSFSAAGEPAAASEWAFDNVSCTQSIDGHQRSDTNTFRHARMVEHLRALPGTADKLFGLRGLGHTLHLLQDLTSPAHVHQDGHPHVTALLLGLYGDPSRFEVFNASRTQLPHGPIPAAPSSSLRSLMTELRNRVRGTFLSEKDALLLNTDPAVNPTVCLDPNDPLTCGYLTSPPPEQRLRARLSQGRRVPRFEIDERVADAQFNELAPLAVAYTAAALKWVHDNEAPLCEQAIVVDQVRGPGAVISESDRVRPGGEDQILCGAGQLTRCDHPFPSGRTVTLFANPDPGAMFIGWSGACASFGTAPCILAMNGTQPIHVSAEFESPITFLGTVSIAGSPISSHFNGNCTFSEVTTSMPAPSRTQLVLNPDGRGTFGASFRTALTRIGGDPAVCPSGFVLSDNTFFPVTLNGNSLSGSRDQGDRTYSLTGTRISDDTVSITLTKTYHPGWTFGGVVTGTFTLVAQ
jgi:hypothetical protein